MTPIEQMLAGPARRSPMSRHVVLSVQTQEPLEFVDITAAVSGVVQAVGLREGVVTLHTRHTTTGLLVNEYEPLLLEDLSAMFERVAPKLAAYAHDDPERRTVNLTPAERRNGHAHCRAALLRSSEQLPVAGGELLLGRWQRILLVELDGGQRREISVALMGEAR